MDQPDHVTKFLVKVCLRKLFYSRKCLSETWKIQQKTIKNACQLRLSENFAVNCNYQ